MLQALAALPLHQLARQSGFFRRSPRKLSLEAFLHTALLSVAQPSWSLRSWAACLSALQQQLFSKQALHKRCQSRAVDFLQALIAGHLGRVCSRAARPALFADFTRVFLQDSTTLSLHRTLAAHFPASGNQSHQPSAGLKIQAVFELLTQRWFAFQLGPFTRTDQQAAADCLDWIKPGDLLLRDLGYAVLPIWQELLNRGAYFVSRLRSDIAIFDQKGQTLDLIALLQASSLSSTQVKVGHSEQIPLRLVALKLPPNLAAQRRRRARANAKRDRRLRLTRRYLKLQDWTLLVTNVEQKTWSDQQVLEAYQCRWQIEVLFKAWKSHFQIHHLPSTANPEQLLLTLCCKLLAIALLQQFLLPVWDQPLHCPFSPLRLAAYFAFLLPLILLLPELIDSSQLAYFCRYDKRPSRPNFFEKLASLG